MRRVAIVQRRLTHYRVPLFERLRNMLALRNVELSLFFGRGTLLEEQKRDAGSVEWGIEVPTHYIAGERLCWQSIYSQVRSSDLVIVPQENRLLHNLVLLLAPRTFKLAFWGHGANFQGRRNWLNDHLRRWSTRQVDWWFAYTRLSEEIVVAAGFPRAHVTTVSNSLDTTE